MFEITIVAFEHVIENDCDMLANNRTKHLTHYNKRT